MDWPHEHWVKLYRRETEDDLLLSWEARALWHEMLKRFNRSGHVVARRGAISIAALVRMPVEVAERALVELEQDGRITASGDGFWAPNFEAAQAARKSGAVRQAEYRQRKSPSDETSLSNETSPNVTSSDTARRAVTPSDDQIRSDQIRIRSDQSGVTRRNFLSPNEVDLTKRDPRCRYVPSEAGPRKFMIFSGDRYLLHVEEREDGSFAEIPE